MLKQLTPSLKIQIATLIIVIIYTIYAYVVFMAPVIKRQMNGENVFIDFSPIQKIDYIANILLPVGVLVLSYVSYKDYKSLKELDEGDKSE